MRTRWTSEKFPEAFKRYEDDIDTSRIRNFQQLLLSYEMWGGKHWQGTEKQVKALAIESNKMGMKPIIKIGYVRKGKAISVHRNVLTGHFTTSEGKETPKAGRKPKEKKPREYYNVRDEKGRFVRRV